jgi:hypothetical protein
VSTFYRSTKETCFIGLDLGEGRISKLNKIRYFPYYKWARTSDYITGAIFEASVDGVNYTQIAEVDQNVKSGWNQIIIDSE